MNNHNLLEHLDRYDFVVITDGSVVSSRIGNQPAVFTAGYKATVLSNRYNVAETVIGGANHCTIGKAELRGFLIAAELIVDLLEKRTISVEPENMPLDILWLCDRETLVQVANNQSTPAFNSTMWEYFFEILNCNALFNITAQKATREEIRKFGDNDVDAHFISKNMKDIHEYLHKNEP